MYDACHELVPHPDVVLHCTQYSRDTVQIHSYKNQDKHLLKLNECMNERVNENDRATDRLRISDLMTNKEVIE